MASSSLECRRGKGNPFFDAGNTESMSQSLGRGLRAGDTCTLHDVDHARVGGFAAPCPQRGLGLAVAAAVYQVKRLEEGGRHGHGTVDAWAAFLFGPEGDGLGLEVHAVGGECQGLRRPAPGIEQGMAGGLPWGPAPLPSGRPHALSWPGTDGAPWCRTAACQWVGA